MDIEIDVKLQRALLNLSKKFNIVPTELRIRISKPKGSLEYEIMQNAEIVRETNLATALNLNYLEAFAVSVKLDSVFSDLSKQNGLDVNNMNVRIFTKTDDCYPSLYLFDGTSPKKALRLEELGN